jgi:hypothetical protein
MSIHRSSAGDIGSLNVADRRAAVQREAEERALQRQDELAAQRSPLNSPQERLRIWERLHSLALPSSRTHKLVRVIAEQTDLTVSEVQDEQRRRAGPAVAAEPHVGDQITSHEGLR